MLGVDWIKQKLEPRTIIWLWKTFDHPSTKSFFNLKYDQHLLFAALPSFSDLQENFIPSEMPGPLSRQCTLFLPMALVEVEMTKQFM
jgi:hypothetical protein